MTVGSSGDQALNAILCGSRDITVFDLCPFAREYYYLKVAAIKTLTIGEFLKFFCYKNYPMTFISNKMSFNLELYLKISEVLKNTNEEIKYFWDEIFMHYNGQIIRKRLFSSDEYQSKIVSVMNRYLNNEDIYNELAKKIDNVSVKFIYGDIFNDTIDGCFDNIFLSNLATYYSLDKMKVLFNKMENALRDNGKMLIAYLYQTDINSMDYAHGEPEIYDLPRTFKVFPQAKLNSFVISKMVPFRDSKMKGSILTYKKVKKI